MRGWRRVIDAVHDAGGRIIIQFWHTGAISHPDLRGAASDVDPEQISVVATGRVPTVAPRPMTKDEIRRTVGDYARAARNAMNAGFDGVQIQANYLYLLAQFLKIKRPIAVRMSMAARSRGEPACSSRSSFGEIESSKVGVKIGPMHETGPFAANDETLPMMG